MKAFRTILPAFVLGVMVAGFAAPAGAQQEKMTMEQWQAQLDACRAREAAAASRIADLDRQIADLRRQIQNVDQQIATARSDVQRLNQQVSGTQSELERTRQQLQLLRFPESYTVVRGDCLWNIAKKDYIYNDPFTWPRIYEANKDQIKDPDLIYPQQVFRIPRP
jgi:nucleoid-associated protein YgaU